MNFNFSAGICFALIGASIEGCAEQPLFFDSEQHLGVGISISGTSTNPVNLTLGYKSVDASFVPVTVLDKSGKYHPVRGCYTSRTGAENGSGCTTGESNNSTGSESVRTNAEARDSLVVGPTVAAFSAGGHVRKVQFSHTDARARAVPLPAPPFRNGSTNAGGVGERDQSMVDSLSIFSSFNSEAKGAVSNGAGIALGKVFATGVAAQQLTEGQNYFLQYQGQAAVYSSAQCIANLTLAMGAGKVQTADLKVCESP